MNMGLGKQDFSKQVYTYNIHCVIYIQVEKSFLQNERGI